MSYMSEDKIASIVDRVVSRLKRETVHLRILTLGYDPSGNPPYGCGPSQNERCQLALRLRVTVCVREAALVGVFLNVDSAAAAQEAFVACSMMGLRARHRIIDEVHTKYLHVENWRMAVRKLGSGVGQKLIKNRRCR